MLEGLAAWVLNNYLGKYVENLNTDQLSIALLSGQVELENLPLRKDALRHLGLPIDIKAGFIGKVKLQIPVRQIRSAPWVIHIEQLYVVASPLPVQEWDSVTEQLAAQELKLSALDNFEAKWRLETESKNQSTHYASTYSSWLSFGTGVITNIIENLQLKIKDVHIRYEDTVSLPNKGAALGITVETLSAQSCESWSPRSDCATLSFKLLEMQALAVYWIDLAHDKVFSKMGMGELATAMSPSQYYLYADNYILCPVSAQARIQRNRSEKPLRSVETPRLTCDLQLDEVPLTLIDWQYEQMVKCFRGLDDVSRLRSYRFYRPDCPVAEDARAWWLYAISCLYPGGQPNICKPRPTWESCLERARENVAYTKLYSKILVTPAVTLTVEEKKIKDNVEWTRNIEDLKVLREIAMKSVPLHTGSTNGSSAAGRGVLINWFPQWMGWYSSAPTETAQSNEATQLEGEILRALSDSFDDNTILKRDVVFGKFSFSLKSGSVGLCTTKEDSKESVPMIELEFKNLSLNITSKPRSASHIVELCLGALYLKDKITCNTVFPTLIGPPSQERISLIRPRGPSPRVNVVQRNEDLFSLLYEKCPINSNCDYRLSVKTKSLDVVYQPAAVKWLLEFLFNPYQRVITHSRIEAMKIRTKKGLIKNWEQILDGRVLVRKIWDLQLDISAPQIFFIEKFNDQNSSMAVIDFGRFLVNNKPQNNIPDIVTKEIVAKESEEDDMFVTPCSTPPVSEESDSASPTTLNTIELNTTDALSEAKLHDKIYDRYNVELTDMQILIGKVRDNWRYAHNKGSSTMHVLDRFNISLQLERRVVHTTDPSFPSLTLNANLPKLVAHFNESKISAARTLMQIITTTGLPSPFNLTDSSMEEFIDENDDEESESVDTSVELSRLLMVQFTIDHMALEVQSRGRSVAELQVSGVKIAFTKRPVDIGIALTVHGLLLVDALQTFGPDFELLVASHKHVGMDSMSGSLRDSEPTSPTSPGSPDPNIHRPQATSPVALSQALSSLASSPPIHQILQNTYHRSNGLIDSEVLISVEITLITGADPMQFANIQFNNLDIIANQETIVELMGFIKRVFPDMKSQKQTINLATAITPSMQNSSESILEDTSKINRTELSFDFHRLNVLLLRGVFKDGAVQGKKICTATMSEAKIQATVDNGISIEGSLGGLQVLDLTPEGHMHQRIISVGHDPNLDLVHPMYVMAQNMGEEERKALHFRIARSLHSTTKGDQAEITIRMASLWYTHSPQFLKELQSCATEFKQYLSHLAKSIKSAATDMALGLVHARLSASIYGSALSFSDIASPRRRRKSSSVEQSFSGYSSVRDTMPQTPYSPDEEAEFMINIKLDVVLDSPVIIIPRSSNSPQVFIGHLGKIMLSNSKPNDAQNDDIQDVRKENYEIEIRDMNVYSLDTSTRRVPGPLMSRPEIVYSCERLAKPMLHDTILQLNITREIIIAKSSRQDSSSNLLLEEDLLPDDLLDSEVKGISENVMISGCIITGLKLSMARYQYEQLIDTISWLMKPQVIESEDVTDAITKPSTTLADIREEDTGVTTLKMDPHVRAKLFPNVTIPKNQRQSANKKTISLKVLFEVPNFVVELRGDTPTGEQELVDLTFREFVFNYEKFHPYETNIQVSLRSILMEDLLQPEGTKQRAMVVSSAGDELPIGLNCISRSCPNITDSLYILNPNRGSLPSDLGPSCILGKAKPLHIAQKNNSEYPCTPPPSPSVRHRPHKNLVLVSTLLVDPNAPNFKTNYNSIERSTSIDFNCLDLVVNVESWVLVIDFFSATSPNTVSMRHIMEKQSSREILKENSSKQRAETNISVRSLTVVLVRPDRDIARANISNLDLAIKNVGLRKEVEGRLGSISLFDLTLHGQLYRERFLTSGKQVLNFLYIRYAPSEIQDYECQLELDMSSILYVHTKRFVAEISAFFNHFTQLQAVMAGIRAATSGEKMQDDKSRLSLIIKADSPVILLPVSSKSADLLVCDLGQLAINNRFKYSDERGCISLIKDPEKGKCLLNVMYLELQNVQLHTGKREMDCSSSKDRLNLIGDTFKLGSCTIRKNNSPLLTKPCHLKLQVERNLDSSFCHNVPDMSIHGELSTLDGTLNSYQYKLIRGLLTYNMGENTEHILPSIEAPPITAETNIRDLWTLSSIRLDLLNVNIRLIDDGPLACISFIKSRLTIDSYSNMSQDIDLVSQEILIRDSRFEDAPVNKRSNVFTNILQPIKISKDEEIVQVEVHNRKRGNKTITTILLNNMRLMAVFDWWEAAREFIFQDIESLQGSPVHEKPVIRNVKSDDENFEFKLNVTESELVVVEDTSQWDTNAVILKSTTVISYRPAVTEKPMSCNLNNCEMYSCILGMEDETALSIIDPVTLNIEVNAEKVLEMQLQRLIVRLSYYDMRMFLQILNSLPKQMFSNKKPIDEPPANIQNDIKKLSALGFTIEDCIHALNQCDHKLDDAALWLTQNALPSSAHTVDHNNESGPASKISSIEVKASCISLCIIDDCGDADVPLLELSLSRLNLRQNLTSSALHESDNGYQGAMECVLAGDYYNRVLSGWEPVIEPWKCLLIWNRMLSTNMSNQLQMNVESKEILNINISSTLTDLYRQVKDNWIQDFYSNKDNHQTASKPMSSPPGYKRRSPFIPFALKNDTGSTLQFTTLISDIDELYNSKGNKKAEETWTTVNNGETVSFRFKSSGKIRHSDTHVMRMHRLGLQVDGYQPVVPVTVDKVGVYFRNTGPAVQSRLQQNDIPPARVVFDISIEGSARKLITVRSALLIVNKLKEDVEVKLENNLTTDLLGTQWAPSRLFVIKSGQTIPVPLMHAYSSITARPIMSQMCTFSGNISWESINKPGETDYKLTACHSPKGKIYRFCAEIKREFYPLDRPRGYPSSSGSTIQPAHTVTLLPTILIVNLLPIDLTYNLCGGSGRVRCGNQATVTYVDTEDLIRINLYLENFPNSDALVIPPNCAGTTYRVKLEDSLRRKLNLMVAVTPCSDARLKITVSVGYWLINKTGLPLVFRQGGASTESAGQFREHESARMIQPLLFSFSDPDASPYVMARVGSNVILDGTPQWSSNFHLQKGCQVRKLRVSHKDGRPDTVFVVGIEIRIGRGKYRDTSIVIISPRFQLYNKTSYQLLFAQHCEVVLLDEPKVSRPIKANHLKAMPDCHMPFHWSRFDKEQLLCVMIADVPDCWWSGGLKIDQNDSLHVNVRDSSGRMYFLRLEVVMRGAMFFVVFTDADTMPPPIRVDNFSEVSISFAQSCCKDIVQSVARAHSSIPYAWDKPREKPRITLEAPGGVTNTYDMDVLGPAESLTYENFIYIAFTGTFKKSNGAVDPLDVESQELVLDVVNKTNVVLARKQQGQRSQLWRMTSTGQLQHEGSGPPSYPSQPRPATVLVLDIEGPAPQPSCYTRLCLQRPVPRRKSTQTWRFTDDGRLCCAHNNMCVQAQDGFFGLRRGSSPVACWQQWSSAVLGLPQPVCHRTMPNGIPLEQAVSRQRMRPGSGFLNVEVSTDGPTKVLSVSDKKDQRNKFAITDDGDWLSIAPKQRPGVVKTHEQTDRDKKETKEFRLTIKLAGLGISLISRKPPEELLFTRFSSIVSEILVTDAKKRFCVSVGDVQIDNQLLDAATPVVLHVTRLNRNQNEGYLPALDIVAEMLPILNENAVIFKHFIVKMNKLTVYLEEHLLLKLFAFVGFNHKEEDLRHIDETDYETQRMLTEVSAAHSTRYYFETIQLTPNQIRLSMRTASKLSYGLQMVKRKLGLTFIKFEDAAVDLEPFKREHSFETLQFLINLIVKHFKDELKWQAAVILGSVDFLGNPLGLVSDVSEGVNGFLREGNVGALVTNIAHGLSNSAAKVTESLSDGLGLMTMDEEHEEMRQRIRQVDSGRSRDHLYAGIKGLGFGVLGGATGIFKQVYEGAVNEGVQGVFSGIGKGLLGVVAKPVVGVLDLASETARAVRDSSRGSSRVTPDRLRPPRCVVGTGGLLPRYSYKQALGQQYLYAVNNRNYSEQLVAYDSLLPGDDDLHIIISTRKVRIVTNRNSDIKPVIEWHLSDLKECRSLKEEENKYYIEITMHVTGTGADLVYQDPVKKPKVRCESAELASVVSQQINYAKRLFDERLQTVHFDNITNYED